MKDEISIIGGAGFVGTYISRSLFDKGIEFEIIDLKYSQQFGVYSKIADLWNIESLHYAISCTICIFLAAAHREDITAKEEYHPTNAVDAKNEA